MTVLALECDPAQAEAIRHVVCDVVREKLTLARTVEQALHALREGAPDLVLLPPLISPSEEAELIASLRGLPRGWLIETLTTPVLTAVEEPATSSRRWLSLGSRPDSARPAREDEARLFAKRLAWSLDRAREQQDTAEPFETGEETLTPVEETTESAVIVEPVEAVLVAPPVHVAPDSESALAIVREQFRLLEGCAGVDEQAGRSPDAMAAHVTPVERRRHPRIHGPFDGRRCGLIDIPILIRDISEGGCFVHSVHEAEVGGRLTLAIEVPGGDLIAVEGQVVSCHSPVGFGVRFVDLPESASARLARLIAKRLENAG